MSTEQQEETGASSYYAAYPLHNESERLMVEIGGVNTANAAAGERYRPVTTTAPTARRKSVSFDTAGDDEHDYDEHERGRSGPR